MPPWLFSPFKLKFSGKLRKEVLRLLQSEVAEDPPRSVELPKFPLCLGLEPKVSSPLLKALHWFLRHL